MSNKIGIYDIWTAQLLHWACLVSCRWWRTFTNPLFGVCIAQCLLRTDDKLRDHVEYSQQHDKRMKDGACPGQLALIVLVHHVYETR